MRKQLLMLVVATTAFADSRYLPITGSAWRLTLGDVNGDGRRELVCGLYHGAVSCVDPAIGQTLWESPVGGFPFAVAAADVTGDGRAEVFAACADGTLYAFGPDGGALWSVATGLPLFDVAIGQFATNRPAFVVCGGIDRTVRVLTPAGQPVAQYPVSLWVHRLAVGDLDGDGAGDILVLNGREQAERLNLQESRLVGVWHKRLKVPDRMKNWENPNGGFHAMSLDLGDLDGDGKAEIAAGDDFHNRQLVKVMRGDAGDLWLGTQVGYHTAPERWNEPYAAAFVRIAGPLPVFGGGRGVIAIAGGLVRLFDADGKPVGQAESRLGFADLAVDGTTLYLGSSPNGDDTIYRIDLAGDWRRAVETLGRQGRAAQVGENLAALRRQALAYRGAAPALPVYDFRLQLPASKGDGKREADWFRREIPYANLRLAGQQHVIEATPVLDPAGQPWNPGRFKVDSIRGGLGVAEIVARARRCEELKTPTVFSIGHSCMPFINLDTAEQMLRAAPNYLVGFESAEDEEFDKVSRYLSDFIGPLADLCFKHGRRKVFLKNKGVWWMSVPAGRKAFDALFTPTRRQVIVAMTEDSNSRTPEINLMARVGLRQAGLLDQFAVSVHSDLFSYNRFHQWEYPKSGSPYLRLLVAQTALGGSQFRAYGPLVTTGAEPPSFTEYGRESADIFLHLLGKGLLVPPRPGEMAGLSRVGLAVHEPPVSWLADGHNGHAPQRWRDDPELHNAVIPHNGCTWGNSPTPAHAFQAVAFRKQRQFGCFVPPTPYGAVAMVPAHADLTKVVGVEEWWHTDGISVWHEGGEKLAGARAAEALRASFEKAAEKLPFRAVGGDVFFLTVQVAPGRYRLYAIDPGWLDPAERRVTVRIQIDGVFSVRDLLGDEDIPVAGRGFPLTVPAGALRILEATRK